MRALKILSWAAATFLLAVTISETLSHALRAAQSDKAEIPSPIPYMEWPLPETDRPYGAIDGKHLSQLVFEQAAISRHYRDQGHPQFWGRIIGTSSDTESAEWLLKKFQQIGLSETRIQPIDLLPQWMPEPWEITMVAAGETTQLSSAQPYYRTPGTLNGGLDVETVYVGIGSEADYAGRDVRGKAVIVFSSPEQPDALKRADQKGAGIIFAVNGKPGNMRYQPYPTYQVRASDGKPEPNSYDDVPTFSLAMNDALAIRTAIEKATPTQKPHIRVHFAVQMVPNLKTGLVWGTLPGMTDETIYVEAHRDGWFDAAGDNASGVASMIGLAEYFAKVPKSQRRRTLVFIGVPGHHNTGPDGGVGGKWLLDHKIDLFAKTALMINCEHTSDVQTYGTGTRVGETDTYTPMEWYAGGPVRPKLEKITVDAFREFGVTTWRRPSENPPGGDLYCAHCAWPGQLSWLVPSLQASSNDFFYFHTDSDTPERIPWTGLAATTRAYAKIIDQVNKLDLKELQTSEETDGRHP